MQPGAEVAFGKAAASCMRIRVVHGGIARLAIFSAAWSMRNDSDRDFMKYYALAKEWVDLLDVR